MNGDGLNSETKRPSRDNVLRGIDDIVGEDTSASSLSDATHSVVV